MPENLLRTRRFLPLFVSQSLGALNDNLFKNALVALVIFRIGEGGTALVALAGALFILPYVLLSATAGQLADRFDKARLLRATKLAEIVLMAFAAWGLLAMNVPALLAVLFGLGVQATFFSPLKFGLLPDHLAENELVRGNALIEAGTFGAILTGTIAGAGLIGLEQGPAIVAAAGLVVAVAGAFAAFSVPPGRVNAPGLRVGWNVFGETLRLVRTARGNRAVWLSILGLSWFWTIGATYLTEFPELTKVDLHGGVPVLNLLLVSFAVGVGSGSILAGRLLHGEISARHVPFAALLLSVFTFGFAWLASRPEAGLWHTPVDIVTSVTGLGALLCLLGATACGGVFSVPLYAIIQDKSDPARVASMIAANNVVNALFIVLGSAVAGGLATLGFKPVSVLAFAGTLNLVAAAIICRLLPEDVLRGLFRLYFRLFHGMDVAGLENVPGPDVRTVVVCNHLSLADGCLLAATLPGAATFVVDTFLAQKWWVRPFLAQVDVLTIDPTNPYAARDMIRAVEAGKRLVIFPEGRITKTGARMKVYDGAGLIADKAGAVVLPVRIDGLEGSHYSRLQGLRRLRWFPRVSMAVLPPVTLTVDPALQGRPRRRALGAAMEDVMAGAEFATRPIDRSLWTALLDARDLHGASKEALEDVTFAPLTFGRLVLGAAVLGRALAKQSRPDEHIGLLLPNANGAVVTMFALQAFGRVPAMLNYSAGAKAMSAACQVAEVRTVLTSRVFVERAKLEKVIAQMEGLRFVWLEDLRTTFGWRQKLRGLWDARRARRLPGATRDGAAPAAVLFTSGSEGTPKGVVLSSRSMLANIAQVGASLDFGPADRVLNAMPLFHAIGLSSATILPLLSGARVFLYPSPLHYRMVPELMYGTDATILFGTDTFLSGWARYAHPYDFRAVRYVIAGAEKVRDETRRTYADRFGVRLLEGYGATETGPVLALNTAMHNCPGTVGRLLPGIEYRIDPMPGIAEGGRLVVRGPNVMLGYLRDSAPGVIEAPQDGWYDTGDIVTVDADRYVTIQGRAKRFTKIAGEMVSLGAAETLAAQIWPGAQHAVLAVPDARKGEQLVLLTTEAGADARALLMEARSRGVPELQVPRTVRVVPRIPVLGSGKTDYPAVAALLAEPAPALQDAD